MAFEFYSATCIIFGKGKLAEAPKRAAQLGKKALVVSGKNPERSISLLNGLTAAGVAVERFTVDTEPTISMIKQGLEQARQTGCDVIIGIGGGSALDAGKAIAALLSNPGDVMDYLETIGRGQPLTQPAAPYIAIPTTAGTGSEVTMNAVLSSPEQRVKVSLRSPLMQPSIAIVDPALMLTIPPDVTASAGMDALTQLIEPFTTPHANPITDALCREGLQRAARSLRRAYEFPEDEAAREDMALAALFSGIALANAKLGAVHGLAGPIGGMFNASHGALCAYLLPPVTEMNIWLLAENDFDHPSLTRYEEAARVVTGNPNASADDLVIWIHELRAALKIPSLSSYSITQADFADIIPKAQAANSMKGNPVALTPEHISEILAQAL